MARHLFGAEQPLKCCSLFAALCVYYV